MNNQIYKFLSIFSFYTVTFHYYSQILKYIHFSLPKINFEVQNFAKYPRFTFEFLFVCLFFFYHPAFKMQSLLGGWHLRSP